MSELLDLETKQGRLLAQLDFAQSKLQPLWAARDAGGRWRYSPKLGWHLASPDGTVLWAEG